MLCLSFPQYLCQFLLPKGKLQKKKSQMLDVLRNAKLLSLLPEIL